MIRDIVKMGQAHGVEIRSAVRGGGAVSSEILRQVKAGDHNLLVIGVETRPGQGLSFGDVPAELLAGCDCSILFVVSEPPGSAGELQVNREPLSGRDRQCARTHGADPGRLGRCAVTDAL